VQTTGLLDHPTLGGSQSYQGMSGHHWATTGVAAVSVIDTTLPSQTMEKDISIRAKGNLSGVYNRPSHGERLWNLRRHLLFGTDVGAFLGHRTFHQQHGE
jgi:hypothetical protein